MFKPEPTNRIDKNAICICVSCEDILTDAPLCYVGRECIPKVTKAIREGSIVSLNLGKILSYCSPPPNSKRFWKGTINISKKGKWLSDKTTYAYNDTL